MTDLPPAEAPEWGLGDLSETLSGVLDGLVPASASAPSPAAPIDAPAADKRAALSVQAPAPRAMLRSPAQVSAALARAVGQGALPGVG